MGRQLTAVGLVLMVGACAAGKEPAPLQPNRATWSYTEQRSHAVGVDVINVIGTPFYALAKGVTCVLTTAVAVPVAIGLGLTERPDRASARSELDRGVGANCGGSYVLGAD